MNVVVQELGLELLVHLLAVVHGDVGLLVQNVVEARSPLSASQPGGKGAVVHHEGDAPGVHVGVEGVHGLDDALVADLAPLVPLLPECLQGGHHVRHVHSGGEWVDWDLTLHALGPNLVPDLPHPGLVDLAHGEPIKPVGGVHHGLDLVAARHVLVDLVADVHARLERRGVGLHESLLALSVQPLVQRLHPLLGDDGVDGSGD
mmetsp:Transcript_10985/g.33557  ORF Transcript_10985/g.33557 Transcript_10985/m.33557 type:complete len:203 (-) Transcript_10985:1140-1748(-)